MEFSAHRILQLVQIARGRFAVLVLLQPLDHLVDLRLEVFKLLNIVISLEEIILIFRMMASILILSQELDQLLGFDSSIFREIWFNLRVHFNFQLLARLLDLVCDWHAEVVLSFRHFLPS